MKTRTKWSVVLLFVLICAVCMPAPVAVYYTVYADAETKKCMEDFLKDFRPGDITQMPSDKDNWAAWAGEFGDNVKFLWELVTRK